MTFNELVEEAREYRANQVYSTSMQVRTAPENTRVEFGFHQNNVILQGQPCDLSWHDCAKTVLSWTNIPPNLLSAQDLGNFLSRSGEDMSHLDKYLSLHSWL